MLYIYLHMQVRNRKDKVFIKDKTIIFLLQVDGMNSQDQHNFSVDTVRPLVTRALRRSKVRKKITEYLFDISPSSSYTSDIAYHVNTTPTNVLGALRGMGNRYKKDESLIYLKIIEQIENNDDIKLYRITDFGKEVIQSIEK